MGTEFGDGGADGEVARDGVGDEFGEDDGEGVAGGGDKPEGGMHGWNGKVVGVKGMGALVERGWVVGYEVGLVEYTRRRRGEMLYLAEARATNWVD